MINDIIETQGIFGVTRIPLDPNGTASYICPPNIKVRQGRVVKAEVEDSHENFAGYNIRRIIRFFKED